MKTIAGWLLLLMVGCSNSLESSVGAPLDPPDGSAPALQAHWVGAGTQTTNAHQVGQTATLLSDGRVLAAGGETRVHSTPFVQGQSTVHSGAEIFDPATRAWAPTGSLQIARGMHRATLLADGRVLVTGGENVPLSAWSELDSAEIYDPSTGTWRATTPMACARANHAQVRLLDGRVLVAGGTDWNTALHPPSPDCVSSVEVFDPATETWSSWAPLSAHESEHEPRADALLLGDGRVLITAQFHDEIYDPSIGSQPPPPPAPVYSPQPDYQPSQPVFCGWPRVQHATALESGSAHILSFRSSFILEPTGSCRSLLGPSEVMTGPVASVQLPSGLILFTFGEREVSLLDPETGIVTPIAPRIYPRGTSHLISLRDGSVLVTGGDGVPSEILEWR